MVYDKVLLIFDILNAELANDVITNASLNGAKVGKIRASYVKF